MEHYTYLQTELHLGGTSVGGHCWAQISMLVNNHVVIMMSLPWAIGGDSPYWLYTCCSISIGYSAQVAGEDTVKWNMQDCYPQSHSQAITKWPGNKAMVCSQSCIPILMRVVWQWDHFNLQLKLCTMIRTRTMSWEGYWTQWQTSALRWLRVGHVFWSLHQFKNKTHFFSFLPPLAQNTNHTYPQWGLQEMRLQLQLCPPHSLPLEASPRQPGGWHDVMVT